MESGSRERGRSRSESGEGEGERTVPTARRYPRVQVSVRNKKGVKELLKPPGGGGVHLQHFIKNIAHLLPLSFGPNSPTSPAPGTSISPSSSSVKRKRIYECEPKPAVKRIRTKSWRGSRASCVTGGWGTRFTAFSHFRRNRETTYRGETGAEE